MRSPFNPKPSRLPAKLALACLLAVAFAAPVFAQTQITTGVIQGNIQDVAGASVPGAIVEVRNVGTNLTKSLTTGASSSFNFRRAVTR